MAIEQSLIPPGTRDVVPALIQSVYHEDVDSCAEILTSFTPHDLIAAVNLMLLTCSLGVIDLLDAFPEELTLATIADGLYNVISSDLSLSSKEHVTEFVQMLSDLDDRINELEEPIVVELAIFGASYFLAEAKPESWEWYQYFEEIIERIMVACRDEGIETWDHPFLSPWRPRPPQMNQP